MKWLRYFRRQQRDEELAREIESYIAHETSDNIARGMTPDEAQFAARRRFGNATQTREALYQMNSLALLESCIQDLRFALRQMRLHPGFTLAAVFSLALGIGANASIFTLLDQVLLRMLPVRDPHELVQLRVDGGRAGSQSGDGIHTFSHPMYLAFRDHNTVFSGLAGQMVLSVTCTAGERSELVRLGLASGNFFDVFGVVPHLGRLLKPEDDRLRNGHPVAVLQYNFWQNRFGGDANVIGSTIRLSGSPFTIAGVTAPGFEGTDIGIPTQVWVPVMMKPTITPTWDALEDERDAWFYLFGRLKPGVSREQAEASMRVLFRQRQEEEIKAPFFQKLPQEKERFLRETFSLVPAGGGQSWLRRGFAAPLVVLQCLVGIVLLIACTNIANLLLARVTSRQKEVAIRRALGASRLQLIRQFLFESIILAVAGGAAGLLLSAWMTPALVRMLPFDPANLSLSTSPDSRVLLFAIAATLTTALLFGLVPAVRGTQAPPGTTLKEEAGAVVGGRGQLRLRKLFVALQVALSCLLLITAGLFTRTLTNLHNVELGFHPENVIMFGVRPASPYDDARKLQVYRSVVEGMSMLPGVKAAGAGRQRLLTGGRWDSAITIPGVGTRDGAPPWSYLNAVTPGYFEALGIPIVAGRGLNWNDWGGSRQLCLVNQALADEYLPGSNPIGRLVGQGRQVTPDREIIGVFANARYDEVRGAIPRQLFVSLDSKIHFVTGVDVYVRATGDPRPVMAQIRDQIHRIDSGLIVSDLRLLDDQLNMRLSNERLLSFLSIGFAALACLLAIVGLHGVLTFVIVRRTREIGIRMALGAHRGLVIRLMVSEMLPVVLLGIATGVASGLISGKLVESQLFGIQPADPAVLLSSAAAMFAVSLVAIFAPAWHASRIDPMVALRHD